MEVIELLFTEEQLYWLPLGACRYQRLVAVFTEDQLYFWVGHDGARARKRVFTEDQVFFTTTG